MWEELEIIGHDGVHEQFPTTIGMDHKRRVVSYKDVCLGVNGGVATLASSDDDDLLEEEEDGDDMFSEEEEETQG